MICTAAAMLCIAFNAFSAKPYPAKWNATKSDAGLYIQLGGGYSFGAGKGYPEQNSSRTRTDNSDSGTESNASYSLGKGVNTILGIGYMLNQNIGLELNADYLIGGSNTVEYSSTNSYSGNKYFDSETETHKLSNLALTPTLKLVAPLGDNFSFYSRIGVTLPIYSTLVSEYDYKERREQSNTITSGSEYQKAEFTPYFKLGYAAALGINAMAGDHFGFFAEVNAAVRSFEPKKGTLTKWTETEDGEVTDMLLDMDAKDKEIEYLKKLTWDSNSNDDSNKEVSYSLPASSVGVTIGIIIKF